MFTSIKMYIYGALAAVGLFLLGVIKYLSSKNDKLKQDAQIQKQNVVVLEKKDSDRKEIDKAVKEVREQAEVVAHENNTKRNKKTKPAVGDSYGDPRLK